ncbi:hypothetical protein AAG570_009819 [Ranatra chinensis]|uniref:alkaline phosphatase n=1 Tax=Ranatra chinensis TaxID=642074 RepID=A0ABD0Z361_9HEMI
MFLGDGMSIATVTAARIYAGQLKGAPGEENNLAFDNFPHTGLSKTYCVDAQVADSACSSTAYLSGVKGSIGTIGVTGEVARKQCDKVNDQTSATSILYWAQKAGKSTGIVTTTRVTHASPAGTYAHTADRDWESDSDVAADNLDPSRCQDIASQLVNNSPGKDINVILGGGWREFLPVNASEEASGRRGDNEDLIKKWALDKEARGARYAFVNDRQSLSNLDTQNTDFLLGLFGPSHMEYHLGADEEEQPTLEEMTRTAINILSRNPKGFFLFVEGGRIDHGHHETLARRALDETVEFSKAVRTADDMTDDGDTLMVTTADHAHTMSFSGYPARGNDILSVAGVSDVDNIPYATLSYANGPGYRKPDAGVRYNVLTDDMNFAEDIKYHFPSGLPTAIETHGGEDVSVYSKGPWAHLLTGVMEQSFIPVAMMYASCLGPHTTMCTPRRDNAPYHLHQVRQDSLLKEATPLR